MRLPALAASIFAASLALTPAAMGQSQQQPPAAQQQPPAAQQQPGSAQNYDKGELKSYASAMLQVQRLNQAYQPQIRAATTPEKQQQVQQQALQQMAAAVRAEGLSVEKYNEISRAMQGNPQVADEVRGYLKGEAN
jgi:hypothetical protein